MRKKGKKKGFTLIELIVVIAILGILAAIAIPKFSGFQGNANKKATLSTLRTIDTAIASIAADKNLDLSAATDSTQVGAAATDTLKKEVLKYIGDGTGTDYPTTSPKGVTYSITGGKGHAAVASGTAWFEAINAAGYTADALK